MTSPSASTRSGRSLRKRLYKLIVAESDFRYALAATRLILKLSPAGSDELFYPLYAAVVVCYGRPFSKNRPLGPLPRSWASFSVPSLQATHDDLVATRNELVAHSDAAKRTVNILLPWTLPGETGPAIRELGYTVRDQHYSLERFPEVEAVCADLLDRIGPAIGALLSELYSHIQPHPRPTSLTFDDSL